MTMQVCFVNTEQKPTKIVRLKMFSGSKRENKYYLSELCEVFYPHPDAPENAIVSVYRWLTVEYPSGMEDSIEFIIKAMNGLENITKLI